MKAKTAERSRKGTDVAGDWIKMRCDLPDDPAVIGVSSRLDVDADLVVGKLHRLWSWADKHTLDGTTRHVTFSWINRYVALPGFAEALAAVGWLSEQEGLITFPGFDRHNGETAKRRADAALRQRASRNRHARVTGRSQLPKSFVRAVLERDRSRCAFCGADEGAPLAGGFRVKLHVDHILPDSRGGLSAIENLITSCESCNKEKSDRTPEEWGILPKHLPKWCHYEDGQVTDLRDTSHKNALPEKRREEKSIKTSTSKDVVAAIQSFNFAADDFVADARKVALTIPTTDPRDRSLVAKAIVLSRHVLSPHWLWDSVEAAKSKPLSKRARYFHGTLRNKAKDDGFVLNELLSQVDVPDDVLHRNGKEPA